MSTDKLQAQLETIEDTWVSRWLENRHLARKSEREGRSTDHQVYTFASVVCGWVLDDITELRVLLDDTNEQSGDANANG